jgi:hypothetical protein
MPLRINTEILIPVEEYNDELIYVRGKNTFMEQRDVVGFWNQKFTEIVTDPDYVLAQNISTADSMGRYSVDMVNETVQVWIWCRALNKIINVSPFVDQLNVNKSEVGSFYISLNPLCDVWDYYDLGDMEILNFYNVREAPADFFHKYLQFNDIAFIRFERLKMERDSRNYFEIRKQQLPGQVWDMIGLLDSNQMTSNLASVDYSVALSGRDLTKLLIEDGSYIFSRAYLLGAEDKIIYDGYNNPSKYFKRLFAGGDTSYSSKGFNQFVDMPRSIADSIGFVANQLSTLGVTGGEDLFSQYLDRRTKGYKITGEDEMKLEMLEVDGIWQIVKFFVDKQIDKRVIQDTSFAQADGSLYDQMSKFCQQPFVEFYGDTYGDQFNFIARQPPFTRDAILSFLNNAWTERSDLTSYLDTVVKGSRPAVIDIEDKDLEKLDLNWTEEFYSAYQVQPNEGVFAQYTNLAVGTIIPIIFFTEIAETFGNRKKTLSDIYLSSDFIKGKGKDEFKMVMLNDLKLLIDSHIYLPFTRQGTIYLNKGDRRIKRGSFIRLKATGEIFYVDGVNNVANFAGGTIDRSTHLQVSRGLIENYIAGDKGWDHDGNLIMNGSKPAIFSYFDIVDTSLLVKNILEDRGLQELEQQTESKYIDISEQVEKYRSLVSKYFPSEEVDNALRIIQAESAGKPDACSPWNNNGSRDYGLFQINDKAHPEFFENFKIYDPEYNTQSAFKIWSKRRNWTEWSTAKIPGVVSNSIPTMKSKEKSSVVKQKKNIESKFSLDKQQYDFFVKRIQLNIYKHRQ